MPDTGRPREIKRMVNAKEAVVVEESKRLLAQVKAKAPENSATAPPRGATKRANKKANKNANKNANKKGR